MTRRSGPFSLFFRACRRSHKLFLSTAPDRNGYANVERPGKAPGLLFVGALGHRPGAWPGLAVEVSATSYRSAPGRREGWRSFSKPEGMRPRYALASNDLSMVLRTIGSS